MKRSIITTLLCTATLFMPVMAQTTWGLRGSIGLEKKITKGFDAAIEAKYHQTDNFSKTDRWSVGVSLDKRLYRNFAKTFSVKASVGYKYMNVYNGWETKNKNDSTSIYSDVEPQFYFNDTCDFNYRDSYVDNRQRFTASLQANLLLGHFKVSIREMYQFTHIDSISYLVSRYRYDDDGHYKAKIEKGYTMIGNTNWFQMDNMEGKAASNKSVLRSKITVEYDITNCMFDPFLSYELFNSIDEDFKAVKSRIIAGIEFDLSKKHYFELAYLWQNEHDEDEPAGSYICIGYKFKF